MLPFLAKLFQQILKADVVDHENQKWAKMGDHHESTVGIFPKKESSPIFCSLTVRGEMIINCPEIIEYIKHRYSSDTEERMNVCKARK